MSRLELQMQITVDGFDANGPNDDLAWDEIRDYSRDLFDSADTIVIGRRTAADFIPYWDTAATQPDGSWYEVAKRIAASRKVVFSRTLDKPEWNNTSIESEDIVKAIERLKIRTRRTLLLMEAFRSSPPWSRINSSMSFICSLIPSPLEKANQYSADLQTRNDSGSSSRSPTTAALCYFITNSDEA
jgi:hypothetical protein